MAKWRIFKWLAALGGLCVILLLAAALLLPRVLDSQAVKEKIRVFLLTRIDGNIAIEKIDLKWFPRPLVVVRGVSLAVGDKVSGKIQSMEIYPSIRGLLMGRLDISRVEMASPAFAVRLPEWAEEPFNIDEIEGQIRALLASSTAEIPGMILTVSGGSAEIRVGDRPPVVMTDLGGHLRAPPGDVDLQISSRANVFDSLRVDGNIAAGTLETKGHIKIERLNLRESIAALRPRPPEYVESGYLSLDVELTARGLKKIKTEINGTSPSLGLVRGSKKAVIEGSTFKAVISRDDGIVNAVIDHLDLVSPRLTATGELTVDPASSSRLKLVGKELDVAQVREWALRSAGDIEFVEGASRYVKGGKIPEMSFQATGRSFADMWRMNNIVVKATLRQGNVFISDLDIDLEDVNGLLVISDGKLEAKQISARLGQTHGRDGALRLGLEGRNAPFNLNMMVQTDAAALRSLLLKVVPDAGFRQELAKVRNVEGQLSGRLVLGERIDSMSVKVSVLQAAVKGSYDPILYPITIKEGHFQYDDGKIALEGVSGAVGLSSFSALTGALSYNESRQIEIDSGKFSLDVEQSKNLLNSFELFQKELRDVDFARGRLDLSSLSLKGPLDQPSRWDFTSTGTIQGIAVKTAKLPGVMNLSGGTFSAAPAKLVVSNANLELLDASMTVEGFLEGFNGAPLSLDATATGTSGGKMTEWLSRQIEVPKPLMLRSPLQVTKGRVLWKEGGDVAFQGDLTVAGGPRLSLDVVQGPQTVEIKEIIIADGEQRARMTLDLERDKFAFSFIGTLYQETLNRIFQVPPLDGSLIQGDIEISAFFEEPFRFTARGQLAGKELWVPLKDDRAIVEFFFLEAGSDGVNIRSADVRLRNSRLSFMGKLLADTKALRLDMNVSADRVVWGEISELIDGGSNHGNNKGFLGIPLPPIEGTVRLKTDNFTFGKFSWSPFQATASITPHGIRGEVERGNVCGIGTVGRVDVADKEIGLDVQLSVTDGQLEFTSRCLTENDQAVKGSYSLKAHFVGQGAPEKILQTLTGEFEFTAQDGQLVNSPAVDATFDYLNSTGDFQVAFPDLDKESFPFRLIRSQGTLEGMTLVNDELIIQSSLFTITGRGKIDLDDKQIDARGLVSVLMPGDRVIKRIPIVGSILGGSILGIPVRVTGSLEHPDVTYLSPTDVGAELLNIPMRILGLPLEAIRLFTPNFREPEKK